MTRYFHSVTLDEGKCKGCTNCIKRCPTEAIRVRAGKAVIIEQRCIDCGECIRTCPNHAKTAVTDTLEDLKLYRRKIALPPPALFSQFEDDVPPDAIVSGLLDAGFDEVFEVALAAEAVTEAIQAYMAQNNFKRPLISSACPAVIRLMQVRFASLLEQIVPVETPMEIAARLAKDGADEGTGAFFISPCPAKMTAVKQPVGSDVSSVDGAIAVSLVYPEILKRVTRPRDLSGLRRASGVGYSWGRSGGEAMAIAPKKMLAVDGIHNVITVLDEVERGRLSNVDYIEAQACTGGCVGGCLMVLNSFLARVRLGSVVSSLPAQPEERLDWVGPASSRGFFDFKYKIEARSVMALDDDVAKAISKMQALEKTLEELPGLDCGSCGSPSCRALAEDIVRGTATEADCTFKLRERVQELAEQMVDLARKVPPAMGTKAQGPAANTRESGGGMGK